MRNKYTEMTKYRWKYK